MATKRKPTDLHIEVGQAILRYLKKHPEGASRGELARVVRRGRSVSLPTTKRAIDWLREENDAPIEYNPASRKWELQDPSFALLLSDPTADDLAAVILAGALVSPIADDALNGRLRRLAEEMDAQLRRKRGPRGPVVRRHAVSATFSTTDSIEPRLLARLLQACGRQVVRVRYLSPWGDEEKVHELEPWQLRFRDGSLYMRAWSRRHKSASTYRVAPMLSVAIVRGAQPSARVPAPDSIWDGGGIDDDRPGVAVIRVRGGLARWLAKTRWHDDQKDRWVSKQELLERRLPYRSCRDLARRLLWLGDAIESIEPPELREEVARHAAAMHERLR